MTSTCLPAIRAPWFPLPSRKESRAPCVPSSLKPKSQSRRGSAIVAHGVASSLLAHSHTDLISSLARHCVTLTGTEHHQQQQKKQQRQQQPPQQPPPTERQHSTTQARGKQPVLRWVLGRCMCIVRKCTGDIPTSIGIVPHFCCRLPGASASASSSVSCDTCLAHFARLGIRIGPLTKSTCPKGEFQFKCKTRGRCNRSHEIEKLTNSAARQRRHLLTSDGTDFVHFVQFVSSFLRGGGF
ncbi:LOW QUALITY PROTEIN: uncharacterized protein LOC122618921 [Drosophila teissieri]|uniref:LOW QUALITY PROTEIN: uncharacterized protein LOC122618921 n=1 Tax=Drosophila teissieri TaxID=7243 RepID=UPI001CBA5894|nr:LOW QUALITY PROTEIN: uncharacterized protein LOC122618921 [Drosophila teissieri]